MSSPLTMLKKTRRIPLQYAENARRGEMENLFTEHQILADPSVPVASPTQRGDGNFLRFKTSHTGTAQSDFEPMSSMMQRLTVLERKVTSQKEEMARKDNVILGLREKLRIQEDSERGHVESCSHLERKCEQLQHQVDDMESFLNDYGLIWVGDRKFTNAVQQANISVTGINHIFTFELKGLLTSGECYLLADTTVVQNFHMDFDLVIQTIKELNILAGESFVRFTPTGAQLARNDPVQLKLYSNGIVMFNGPFRSYRENSTQQCMQDLMEGYFPSELQDRFPDGVPFEVHDRRDEEFVLREPCIKFPGRGLIMRERKEDLSVRVSSQFRAKTLSTKQFLNRLPKMVVKAGRVIDIRDSARTALQASPDAHNSCSAIIVETPALQAMKDSLHTITSDLPSSARNVITLKVKSEDGDHTYVLKMCISETVGHLRQHLDTHRGHNLAGYDIISAYPQCHYQDDCQTLGSCGLTTNVTLLLRGRKNTNKSSI
ncbi:UBX domain-containing protein 11 isoform X3 [Hippocampus zosterae]|uniref:UBX domain-containing protein 11 isoform X3 n=1 Tax=Hippocampus zosterae TaxID=109293 RepID=UPI00223E275F|nr:UBX domain-containing protein 11 isoform X3 [Hippocampus zosterae]